MASTTIQPYTSATISVPASSAIATSGVAAYVVYSFPTFANYPTPLPTVTFSGSGLNTTSAFTNATTVVVQAGGSPVTYNVGTGPVIFESRVYATPATLNATGTLTTAMMLTGIVTSTTAAAVTATLDTGALIDAAATFAVGDFFDWVAINTGASNAFTIAASTGHTIVGAAAVALSTSARFKTVKTAAATFVTYRIA